VSGDPPPVAFRIELPHADEEAATTVAWEAGTLGIQVESREVGPCVLLAYFPPEPGLERRIRAALEAVAPRAVLERVEIPEVDWLRRFREGFRHFQVESFLVAPPWDVPSPRPGPERLILMDPGRAFGTGTHESTRLCLKFLHRLAAGGRLGRVLDLGTGTGLLAIAASKLGAERVVAVDIDPDALRVARHHLELNSVCLGLAQVDGTQGLRTSAFDLVLANLTAADLLERRDEIGRVGAPGARLVLAGFLLDDLDSLSAAYRPFGSIEAHTEGEWASLCVSLP